MILLAIGDVCGESGIAFFEEHIRALRKMYGVDVCVVNGENTDVTGILPEHAERLYDAGADAITLGNHAFRKQQISRSLDDLPYLLRPHNYSGRLPGTGVYTFTLASGLRLGIVNLIGRYACEWNCDSPFTALDAILEKGSCDLYVVDFHAEATSEKMAFGFHADGRVSAVWGTHTHVQTSDERILPGGTGYITDLGMTGVIDSVLGMRIEQSLALFLGEARPRFEPPKGACKLEGALITVDEAGGRCVSIERIRIQ